MGTGPKSELTENISLEIRKLVLQGKSYVDIQQILEINANTWDFWVWKNYQGFRKLLNEWKCERMIKKSEQVSEEILDINYSGDKGVDSRILSIKQKEAEFIRSTLDKDNYSKRNELTGKDGTNLIPESNKESEALADKLNELEKNGIHSKTS